MNISCFNAMDYAVEVVIREASSHVNNPSSAPHLTLRQLPLPDGEGAGERVPSCWSPTALLVTDRAMAGGACLGGSAIKRNQPAGFTGQEPIQQQAIALFRYRSHQGDLLAEHYRRQR
jgi:hypothetical protein